MSSLLRHRLPYGRTAPAAARRVLDVLRGVLDPEDLSQLRLLVSELVTNAVRHGRPARARGDGVELIVYVDGRRTRVEVMDGGDGFVPPAAPSGADRLGGWGLVVVDELASRWGVETNGKTLVWLEFDAPSGVRHMAGSHS
jgi:anti-sigma regulatory factor (Ser/Thr protein kinase)